MPSTTPQAAILACENWEAWIATILSARSASRRVIGDDDRAGLWICGEFPKERNNSVYI